MGDIKAVFFTMAYNAQNTLRRTIDSILAQTHRNFEYYILDNGSTDATREIIAEYRRRDSRVILLRVNKNDPTNGGMFFSTLIHASAAKYIVWCDADDTYSPEFLETMIGFAEENRLDIAACGYDMIDGETGKLLKHRVSSRDMILHGGLFADEFIDYRGFMLALWGKLFSIPFFRNKVNAERENLLQIDKHHIIYGDSIWILRFFRWAKRVGIHEKAMYQYYRYSSSLSRINVDSDLYTYRRYWRETKAYLEAYGPISRRNEDFLYAIYLSLADEALARVLNSDFPTEKKLALLERLYDDPVWTETLARDAGPEFHNLAGRGAYVAGVKRKIAALPGADTYPEALTQIFSHLVYAKEA